MKNLLISTFITLLFASSFASVAAADAWPQYRGIAGDGISSESIANLDWPANGPTRIWKIPTPLGFSSFSVSDGQAYTLVVRKNDKRKNVETCVALDADSGRELWQVKLASSDYGHGGGNSGASGNKGGDGPRSTPSSDGKRVYVYDSHMLLSCFDAENGELVWSQDIVADFGGEPIKWLNATSPLLDDQHVYVGGGGAGKSFLAFEKTRGELVWASGNETITHATPRLATIDGIRQVVFFARSGPVAVNADTGQEIWRSEFPFSVSTAASPQVDENYVYCSAGYGVGAGLFEIAKKGDGYEASEVWFEPNKLMNHWSTPVIRNGHLYGLYEFKKYGDAPLQCVELKTGKIKWSHRGFGPGNCILVGDKLIVLADDGHLAIVEARPDAYTELARAKVIEGKCWSTPAFSDGRVYVRSTKEGACIDLSN